jgi:hypothetical protein
LSATGKASQPFITPTTEVIRALLRAPAAAMKMWLALALHADWHTGRCYPSYDTLRKNHGFSRDTVSRGISALIDLGLLTRTRRYSKSNVYGLRGYATLASSRPKPGLMDDQKSKNQTVSRPENQTISSPVPLTLTTVSSNDRQERDDMAGAAAPPPPLDQDLERLLGTARSRKVYFASPTQLRSVLESWQAEKGAASVLAVLEHPDNAGRDILDLHREATKRNGVPFRPRRGAPDRDCRACSGSGERHNPATKRPMPCHCTDHHNPRG